MNDNNFKQAEASYLATKERTCCERCCEEDRESNSEYCKECNVWFAREDLIRAICDKKLCEVFVDGLRKGSSGVALAEGYRLIEKKISWELTKEIMEVFDDE